jgi:ketosteroid isomerase-like protein
MAQIKKVQATQITFTELKISQNGDSNSLEAKLKRTGKIIKTDFAIVLTVANGKIVRFQMLEDSFAVAQAASADRVLMVVDSRDFYAFYECSDVWYD